MSFSFHEITKKDSIEEASSADDFPVFLLPDVTGDCTALYQMGLALEKARKSKGQIFLWNNPEPSEKAKNFDLYAKEIASAIIRLNPHGPTYLGGFSWGGSLARVVAQKLIDQKRKVAFYAIDTPSIEGSQAHLKTGNLVATQDLIAIFQYACTLASHYGHQALAPLVFKEEDVINLSKKDIHEQLQTLCKQFIKNADESKAKTYLIQYTGTIVQNLTSLLQYKGKLQPLPKVGLYISEESQKKFSFNIVESWKESGREGVVNTLPRSTHFSLLKDKASCEKIAEQMSVFFRGYFSALEIAETLAQPLKRWVDSNGLEIESLLHLLKTSKPHQASCSSDLEPYEEKSPFFLPFSSTMLLSSEEKTEKFSSSTAKEKAPTKTCLTIPLVAPPKPERQAHFSIGIGERSPSVAIPAPISIRQHRKPSFSAPNSSSSMEEKLQGDSPPAFTSLSLEDRLHDVPLLLSPPQTRRRPPSQKVLVKKSLDMMIEGAQPFNALHAPTSGSFFHLGTQQKKDAFVDSHFATPIMKPSTKSSVDIC